MSMSVCLFVQDTTLGGGRGAEGAEGGEVWGGGVPLPTGGGIWGFDALWRPYFTVQLAVLHAETGTLGFRILQ